MDSMVSKDIMVSMDSMVTMDNMVSMLSSLEYENLKYLVTTRGPRAVNRNIVCRHVFSRSVKSQNFTDSSYVKASQTICSFFNNAVCHCGKLTSDCSCNESTGMCTKNMTSVLLRRGVTVYRGIA